MSQRANQVAEELRRIISMIFLRDLNEPLMSFVTITRIEVADDLRFGRVFYSIMGNEDQVAEAEKIFAKNRKTVKQLAIEKINLRYAMEIRFERDHSIEHSLKIDEILKKIKEKGDGK